MENQSEEGRGQVQVTGKISSETTPSNPDKLTFKIERITRVENISVEVVEAGIATKYNLHAGGFFMRMNEETAVILSRMLREALEYNGR